MSRSADKTMISAMVDSSPTAIDRDTKWLEEHVNRCIKTRENMLKEGHTDDCVGVSFGMRGFCSCEKHI